MIIIGDSTVAKLPADKRYTVNSYPGMTLFEYLTVYNELQEAEDIIIYSFGTNDGLLSDDKLRGMYEQLKRGSKHTYYVIPQHLTYDFGAICEENWEDSMTPMYTLLGYEEHDIHSSIMSICLYSDIMQIILKQ